MQAVRNYVLVEYEEESQTTKNGLYVPQGSNMNATDILIKGKVINKGSEVKEEIKVGDTIFYNKHAITKVPECKTMILVRQEDIYAID